MDAAFWNERYGQDRYVYGEKPNDFLVESLSRMRRHGRVLCIGDGEGRNGVYLASQQFEVTSVDKSREGKRKAELLAQKHKTSLHYVVADLDAFDMGDQQWDAIVSIFCHLPKALRGRVHKACIQGLKPGGVMVIEAYRPEQLRFNTGGPKDLDLLLSLDDAKRELEGLSFAVGREVTRNVSEGEFHDGEAAVTQVVGIKV